MTDVTFEPSKTAIVFIEYQNEFTTEGGKLYDAVKPCMEATNFLENSKALLKAARAKGIRVFHIPIGFSDGHQEIGSTFGILANIKGGGLFAENEWNYKFHESMEPIKGEIVVKGKSGLCAFASTNLDFLLRQAGVENLAIAGLLTNCCVESTMRTAYELGFKNVITVTDCASATSLEAHEATIKNNFGMFSLPQTHTEFLAAVKA